MLNTAGYPSNQRKDNPFKIYDLNASAEMIVLRDKKRFPNVGMPIEKLVESLKLHLNGFSREGTDEREKEIG